MAQSASLAHPPGQPGLPLHTKGVHDGRPAAPTKFVHVPFAVAPCAVEQAWHAPEHMALQQKPSTHPPALPHSRQPLTLQSTVVLHAVPASFCCWHTPFSSQ